MLRAARLSAASLLCAFICAGCTAPNPLDFIDQQQLKETINHTIDTVQEQTEEIVKNTKEGLEQPVEATEATGKNVKTREQMMEEAGGQMIDEMR